MFSQYQYLKNLVRTEMFIYSATSWVRWASKYLKWLFTPRVPKFISLRHNMAI